MAQLTRPKCASSYLRHFSSFKN